MLVILLLTIACEAQIQSPLTTWTKVTNPSMPVAEATLFIAYEEAEDRIWLIGGGNDNVAGGDNKIWTYNIVTNNFSDYGQLSIHLGIINSQCSVQWSSSIYFVNEGHLQQFLFNTAQIGTFNSSLTYPREAPCVAALYPDYIFATGGIITSNSDPEKASGYDSKYFQIYNHTSGEWIAGPNMLYSRSTHACIVHNNWLYVFGGQVIKTYYATKSRTKNEKIYVGTMNNIASESWSLIDYQSGSNEYFQRAVVHDLYNQIYLVGGRDIFAGAASRNVQIYDIQSDTIEIISSVKLNYGRSSTAAIIQNNILYVFGGAGTYSGSFASSWEYSNLLTVSPTTSPTPFPTNAPTIPTSHPTTSPSKYPTVPPSKYPTISPTLSTNNPSNSPTSMTQSPTFDPTYFPSKMPTISPSRSPTYFPSKTPTGNTISPTITTNDPSMSPSKTPSNYPTESPSKNPSQSPTYPTEMPTEIPTANPTTTPSRYPSKSPTTYPTRNPTVVTAQPTYNPPTSAPSRDPALATWCISVLETMTGITTNDFANDDKLLFFTKNNTKLAIYDVVKNSNKYDINTLCPNFWRCYFVEIININGGDNTAIDIDVCAWTADVFDALLNKIDTDNEEMTAFMEKRLKLYLNKDNITVSFSVESTHIATTNSIDNDNGQNNGGNIPGSNANAWIFVSVVLVILLLGTVIVIVFFCYKRSKDKSEKNVDGMDNYFLMADQGVPLNVQMERINSIEGKNVKIDGENDVIHAINNTHGGIHQNENTSSNNSKNNNDSGLNMPPVEKDYGDTEGNDENVTGDI